MNKLFFIKKSIPLLVILLFLMSSQTLPQPVNYVSKKGGICFRTDDDQPMEHYTEYASIFNKYNQKFTFAINLGKDQITPDYVNMLKDLQAHGHEMMDHTPWHSTVWFATKLSTDIYQNRPGVHKISNNNIELEYDKVNTDDAKRSGYVNIEGNRVISSDGIFSNFSKADCYLYFPALDTLVFINNKTGWISEDTVKIENFWGKDIDLGTHHNFLFYNFDYNNVHLTTDAIKVLAQESQRLAEYYNLKKPVVWIQPGGYHPHLHRHELMVALSNELNYKAAGIFPDPSLKVFNEYNYDNDKQFGMNYGDFRDDIWNLEECKAYIADKIAKHHVVFGISHFTWMELLGGWDGFLNRTDSLIQWSIKNNIPIRTYSEWADILYNQIPDPYENIIPSLNVDLDKNGIPDGYSNTSDGMLDTLDGAVETSNFCFKINKVGEICKIENLAGVEKGENTFEIWTKGEPGDSIEVIINFNHTQQKFKFPADHSDWKKYDILKSSNNLHSLNIPENVSSINFSVRCSDYNSGTVKISNMSMSKPTNQLSLNLLPDTLHITSKAGTIKFNIQSNGNWIIQNPANWLTLDKYTGAGNDSVTISYENNFDDSARIAKLNISVYNLSDTLTIIQNGKNYFNITAFPDSSEAGLVLGSGNFPEGTIDTLKAIPNDGWKFIDWLEDSTVVSTDSVYIFAVDKPRTFIAEFHKITTGLDSNDKTVTNFQLFQNYPNPFNPSTVIKYSIPKTSNVKLDIYDILGNQVAELVNEKQLPGNYRYTFNGFNLPSGIYFYRITTKTFNQTRKLILLK